MVGSSGGRIQRHIRSHMTMTGSIVPTWVVCVANMLTSEAAGQFGANFVQIADGRGCKPTANSR